VLIFDVVCSFIVHSAFARGERFTPVRFPVRGEINGVAGLLKDERLGAALANACDQVRLRRRLKQYTSSKFFVGISRILLLLGEASSAKGKGPERE